MKDYKLVETKRVSFLKKKVSKPLLIMITLAVFGIGIPIPITTHKEESLSQLEAPIVHVDTSAALISWIRSHNPRISDKTARAILSSSTYWASIRGLDPLLVLSLIKIESRFNVFAVSNSNAIGLMQYIPRWHKEKITQETNPFDINSNISIGTLILKEYIDKHGTVEKALLKYNGALNKPNNYASNVLKTRKELKEYLNRQVI
jgi:soluble lytic murein transglycosylase-like protein